MTTESQLEANKQNALLSTGPITSEGKAIVSQNAIKHGIFARDLLISTGDGKENEEEYRQLLGNLIENLSPQGQMEHLLVEKIAVDFWRLRRVLRFETGSIRQHLDMVIYNYYNKKNYDGEKAHPSDADLNKEIRKNQECITWNNAYIEALKKGIVKFDKATWSGEGLESNIEEDLYLLAETIDDETLSQEDAQRIVDEDLSFGELKKLFERAGYTDQAIAEKLIPELEKQNEEYKQKIYDLEQSKLQNKVTEKVMVKINSLPPSEDAEKVMRYESSLQTSILRNLAILKKLQTLD